MEDNNNHDLLSRGCKCGSQSSQAKVFEHSCYKLDAFDWLNDIKPPDNYPFCDVVEVRFKNSRKEFFRTTPELELQPGDIIAVEASPGHDLGIVTLTGEVVKLQMKNKKVNPQVTELRKVYRKAKVSDIEKWVSAVKQEDDTMFRSRQLAQSLKLDMKISDVEYQGDRTKAIFYYTADERVDFRELIRVLADSFGVRIEMRQIGMRQEASRLGGIGSCGRELCCSTWLTNFRSVSTNAARTQQLSLNPQKLAGQCSKLKCCINYETDCYLDALKEFPDNNVELLTKKGKAFFQKADVLRKTMNYFYGGSCVTLGVDRVAQIQEMNRRKQYPEDLIDDKVLLEQKLISESEKSPTLEDSLTRFDQPKTSKKKKRRKKPRQGPSGDKA